MSLSFRSAALAALAVLLSAGGAQAAYCSKIMKDFPAASGIKLDFVRPVVVGRGVLASGVEVYDVVNDLKVDGQLRCMGDVFQRFDARISASAPTSSKDAFAKVQRGALMTILGWSAGRASGVEKSMASNAAEYLRASIERGDVEIAGKVEEHAGAAGDVGVIWTPNERAFVLVHSQ
jgi:hypothetical protein